MWTRRNYDQPYGPKTEYSILSIFLLIQWGPEKVSKTENIKEYRKGF